MRTASADWDWHRHYAEEHNRNSNDEFKRGFMARIAHQECDYGTSSDWQDGWYRADGDIEAVLNNQFAQEEDQQGSYYRTFFFAPGGTLSDGERCGFIGRGQERFTL